MNIPIAVQVIQNTNLPPAELGKYIDEFRQALQFMAAGVGEIAGPFTPFWLHYASKFFHLNQIIELGQRPYSLMEVIDIHEHQERLEILKERFREDMAAGVFDNIA